jgi:hypothetical protein
VSCLVAGSIPAAWKSGAQAEAGGTMQFADAEGSEDAVFAASGTASATVAMATIFRKEGRSFRGCGGCRGRRALQTASAV